MHKLTLDTFGLEINSEQHQTARYGTIYREIMFALPGQQLTVGEYFPAYGYLRLSSPLRAALTELYKERFNRKQLKRYRKESWLQYERPFIRHLHLARLRLDPHENHTYVQFLTALYLYANLRDDAHQYVSSQPNLSSPHAFEECLIIASLPNLDLSTLKRVWQTSMPIEMLLLAAEGKYVGLIEEMI